MKNIKWKELAINHIEKAVLIVAALFSLTAIGTSKWAAYDRIPKEFTDKVAKGKQNFAVSQWDETKQADFTGANVGDRVNLVMTKPAAREFSTRWIWPMEKKQEPIKEPEIRKLLEPVADGGRLLLAVAPAVSNLPSGGIVLQDQVEPPNNGVVGTEPPRGIEPPRGVEPPRNNGTPNNLNPIEPDTTVGAIPDQFGNPTANNANGAKADGRYFVSFRAIFPMKEQIDKYRQALNLETTNEALSEVKFWDFELERQTARGGADPWAGDWEKVDIDYALNLLNRVEFDVPVVPPTFRDSIFTMPLPFRQTGNWLTSKGLSGRTLASHPRIRKLLSDEEAAVEEEKLTALIEVTKKEENVKNNRKRGFDVVQHDSRGMQNVVNSNAAMMQNFNSQLGMANGGGGGDASGAPTGIQGMPSMNLQPGNAAQAAQLSEFLLFRFLDFNIVPGNAYRYRARLVLKNPIFQREGSELLDSRDQQFLTTAWSDPSTPAVVHDNAEFYVSKVKAPSALSTKTEASASIDVYQWMKETGSYVQGRFEDLRSGDRIAVWKDSGTTKKRSSRNKRTKGMNTLVLRPLEQTYAKEIIDYITPNTLVAVDQTRLIDPNDYPELNLSSPKKLSMTFNEIVMLNRFGELETKNNATQEYKYGAAQTLMASQESVWSTLRQQSENANQNTNALDNLIGGGDGTDPEAMMSGASGSSGRRSSGTKRFQPPPGMSGAGSGAP